MKMRGTEACFSFSMSFSRMIWSSTRSFGKSFLFAYQRDCQLRRTARRKPIGLVFWPMEVRLRVGVAVREDDADVRHLLAAGHRGAARAGLEALEDGAVLDDRALHGEAVGREVVVVLGVRDGAFQRLRDQLRALARDEHQIIDGVR